MITIKHLPSKRLRNWHRSMATGLSLRAFARRLAADATSPRQDTAKRWLSGKGTR